MAISINKIQKPGENFKWKTHKPDSRKEISTFFQFGKKLSDKKKEHFFTQLAILISSGIDLKSALELYKEELEKENEKNTFREIYSNLLSGNSLFECMELTKSFSMYDCYSVKVAEETGRLGEVLEEIGAFYKKKNSQRKQIISALTYPAMVLVTAILAVGFMLKVVVPLFAEIYKRSNLELPQLTQTIIKFSDIISDLFLYTIVILPFLIVAHVYYRKNNKYRSFFSGFLLRLPFAGPIIKLIFLERFFQTFHLLNRSKVPILNGLQLIYQMIGFYPLQKIICSAEQDILNGKSLYFSLNRNNFFERRVLSLIKVGEESNTLDNSFNRIKMQYGTEVNQKLTTLQNVLEPLLIIFIGALVGVILIAMYLPMFQMSSAFQ